MNHMLLFTDVRGKIDVNALISEKERSCKVADAPCTSKVDEYKWRDITFVDTPGIHAPIEHQRCALKIEKGDAGIVCGEYIWDF